MSKCLTDEQFGKVVESLCEITLPGVETALLPLVSATATCCSGCAGNAILAALKMFSLDRLLQQFEATKEARDELHRMVNESLKSLQQRRDTRIRRRGIEPSEN